MYKHATGKSFVSKCFKTIQVNYCKKKCDWQIAIVENAKNR